MSRKASILLVLLVILPLTALTWFGWRIGQAEEVRVEQRYRQVLAERLREENQKIDQYFERVRRELTNWIEQSGESTERLRELVRSQPLLRQAIILDREGELVHPDPRGVVGRGELIFLEEIQQVLIDRDLITHAYGKTTGSATAPVSDTSVAHDVPSASQSPAATSPAFEGPADGWYVWYWGRGIHLIYWRKLPSGNLTVLALSRPRWMSELLSALPSTALPAASPELGLQSMQDARIQLVDSENRLIYQWGNRSLATGSQPLVTQAVVAPLASWRLKYFVHPSARRPVSQLPLLAALIATACSLLGLVLVFAREYAREMREARQRVNFVNQVSHELKTPLTNIRLYADLLEIDLEHDEMADLQRSRERLQVIVSESQRLSRLITNVLTLARSDRRQLQPQPRWVQVDESVRRVVEHFRPALESRAIQIRLQLDAERPVWTDEDFLDQILGNLVGNVLRHAHQGGWLQIETQQAGDRTWVRVSDRGPGIRPEWQRRIFEPFFRGSQTTESASETGTGIGLSIARRLARLQAGELRCLPTNSGTRMELALSGTRLTNEE